MIDANGSGVELGVSYLAAVLSVRPPYDDLGLKVNDVVLCVNHARNEAHEVTDAEITYVDSDGYVVKLGFDDTKEGFTGLWLTYIGRPSSHPVPEFKDGVKTLLDKLKI